MTSAVTSRTTTTVLAIITSILLLAALAAPALAAHNGNNRAELSGGGTTGHAVVNYSEGKGTFNGTATVRGLAPGMHTFTVNGPAGVQEICSFTAGLNGAGGCSAQDLPLGGFGTAQIRDAAGAIVAAGTFDRAGNCRDPQQGGSQCESPALNP